MLADLPAWYTGRAHATAALDAAFARLTSSGEVTRKSFVLLVARFSSMLWLATWPVLALPPCVRRHLRRVTIWRLRVVLPVFHRSCAYVR